MVIDWSKFEQSSYIKFDENIVKKLILTGWREDVAKFEDQPAKPALVASVVMEDGKPCEPLKEFKASNHTLVMGLRPIIEKADSQGVSTVSVAIKKSGSGRGTTYMVMEV